MEKFTNPKLQKFYEALADLYPTAVGWQDMGDEDCELIAFSVSLTDPDKNISTPQTVWFSATSAEILGSYKNRSIQDESISFTFTDFKKEK
jgi:hypothetical protein